MKDPARKLTRTYIFALSLIALLSFVGQIVVHYSLSEQDADAMVINISGRQRMLSQKIAKNALLLQQAEGIIEFESIKSDFEMAYTLWDVSHQGLTLGDGRLAIPENYNSETIQQLFKDIEIPYQKIKSSGQKILNVSPNDSSTLKAAVKEILEHEVIFLMVMNQITFQYEAESEAKIAYIRKVELGLFLATLMVLLLEVLFVFRPAVQKVRQFFDLAR
ncbi:MAG: type IV pili methyl-accepting chemotaxis transducer N-terminal domain-containing protein, partial [Bacteroidota bacterium]